MAIDTTGLSGWPSPAHLQAGARELSDAGPQLENAILDVSATWNGLQTAYMAPEADQVYGVFSDITPHGNFVSAVSVQAARALETFADGIAVLEGARAVLLADIAGHNAFVNSAACTEEDAPQMRAAGDLLQGRVNTLAAEILQLEQECVQALSEATGETNPLFSFASTETGGFILNTVDTLRGGAKSRGAHSAAGPRNYYDLRPEVNEKLYNASQRYARYVDANPDKWAVVPDEFRDATKIGKAARAAGPVMVVGGGLLTFGNERQDEINRLREANPGMSEADIEGQANEKAIFRAGTSVAAGLGAGYAGAAVGTMIGGPVGTVVGFGVGMAISWAVDTELDIFGGRSLTQAAGDGVQNLWNAVTENEKVEKAAAKAKELVSDAKEAVEGAIGKAGAAMFKSVFGR
ncbi:hypothetical protein [Arthrobacter sp. zg-Y750]|uniref:hypothetical protein n=1 Tax=Arthrobacter sp. zg-Y750 TaxID=2894189 RepID=UPI001E3853EE|nr:hypothetical protein [Arthrobacter sp. zg-Y750]MCC9176279.1 hypothetical protein [Arthrobacter sp. zg-Y750]